MCQWTWIKSCHRAHYYDAQIINTLLLSLSQWWACSIIHLVFYCSCRGVAISPTSGSIKICYILGVHSTYTDMGWQYADRTCFAGDSTDTGLYVAFHVGSTANHPSSMRSLNGFTVNKFEKERWSQNSQ